jgi:hypothetical protein
MCEKHLHVGAHLFFNALCACFYRSHHRRLVATGSTESKLNKQLMSCSAQEIRAIRDSVSARKMGRNEVVEKYKTSENGHGITRSFSSHNALQRQGL